MHSPRAARLDRHGTRLSTPRARLPHGSRRRAVQADHAPRSHQQHDSDGDAGTGVTLLPARPRACQHPHRVLWLARGVADAHTADGHQGGDARQAAQTRQPDAPPSIWQGVERREVRDLPRVQRAQVHDRRLVVVVVHAAPVDGPGGVVTTVCGHAANGHVARARRLQDAPAGGGGQPRSVRAKCARPVLVHRPDVVRH